MLLQSADPRRRLVTAQIIYRLPDHPALLQRFILQKWDLLPEFPEIRKFLEFWSLHIEGKLHEVTVNYAGADVKAPGFRNFRKEVRLH